MIYQDSWYELPATGPSATALSRLPSYANIVVLSFARPDAIYSGGLNLSLTGLQYPFSGQILRDSIVQLKNRQPQTRVLLAVGGSAYTGWSALNVQALAQLVQDLGIDGIDIDYEPTNPGCRTNSQGTVHCTSDRVWIDLVTRFRNALPRPYLITIPAWSVGAYGEGIFANAKPPSPYTGSMLALLRSPVAAEIDLLTIMAYDAGPSFDPWQSWLAYRAVWKGPLALGVQVPPSFADGPNYTVSMAEELARKVMEDPKGGMMLYAMFTRPTGALTPDNPDGRMLSRALCEVMELGDCGRSLY